MKITIEPTYKWNGTEAHCTVTVEDPNDGLHLDTALYLVAAALKAYGYSDESVNQAIPPR